MRRAFRIFGAVYLLLLGTASVLVGFFHESLPVSVDDTLSIKLVVLGAAAWFISISLAGHIKDKAVKEPSNV